jgi:predicted ATPase
MRIESIRLKNFRAFHDVHMRDIPGFCVLIGANGTGKSTLFSVFSFLRDAMTTNVTAALGRLGGSRGIQEVRSRGTAGSIEIELKIRADLGRPQQSLITYSLSLAEEGGRPVVEREILKYRRGSAGQPWHFIDFSRGTGEAVTNEMDSVLDETQLRRETQTLKSPDILAIKGLAQFERFPAAVALGTLIENWHLSDFHISRARPEQEVGYAEHLSREGENLSLVIEYLHKQHPKVFGEILKKLASRVPGITSGIEGHRGGAGPPQVPGWVVSGPLPGTLRFGWDDQDAGVSGPPPRSKAAPTLVCRRAAESTLPGLVDQARRGISELRNEGRAGIRIDPLA